MTTSNNTLLTQVINELKQLSDSSLQIAHNNYCDAIGYEDVIYDNDEYNINEIFITPFDALRSIEHYNLADDYFYLHNGNLVSFNYLTGDDRPITFSELAQWIVGNDLFNDYGIEVTTLDDMLASIEDNITDDEDKLVLMFDYLGESVSPEDLVLADKNLYYNEYLIALCTDKISDYDYNQLNDIILMLGINYK